MPNAYFNKHCYSSCNNVTILKHASVQGDSPLSFSLVPHTFQPKISVLLISLREGKEEAEVWKGGMPINFWDLYLKGLKEEKLYLKINGDTNEYEPWRIQKPFPSETACLVALYETQARKGTACVPRWPLTRHMARLNHAYTLSGSNVTHKDDNYKMSLWCPIKPRINKDVITVSVEQMTDPEADIAWSFGVNVEVLVRKLALSHVWTWSENICTHSFNSKKPH